jgi:transmembrane sensor
MKATDDRVRELIAEQAADWFIDNRGGLSVSQRNSFNAWLKTSPLHVEEYLTLAAITRDLRAACEHSQSSVDELLGRARDEQDELAEHRWRRTFSAHMGPRWPRMQTAGVAFAALCALTLGLVGLWKLKPTANLTDSGPITTVHFETRHGEQQTRRLADNSVIHLNTDTAVTIRFGKRDRLVVLSSGEADFEVAHERERAFRVLAGAAQIVATGTNFEVQLQQQSTLVTVIHGQVAVGPPQIAANSTSDGYLGPKFVQLEANQQIRITNGARAAAPSAVDAQHTTAWLHRQIMFEHEPLERVAREFNRYASKPFEITTPALRALEISGVFATDDTAAFIAFLRSLDGVRVEITATRIRVVQD